MPVLVNPDFLECCHLVSSDDVRSRGVEVSDGLGSLYLGHIPGLRGRSGLLLNASEFSAGLRDASLRLRQNPTGLGYAIVRAHSKQVSDLLA